MGSLFGTPNLPAITFKFKPPTTEEVDQALNSIARVVAYDAINIWNLRRGGDPVLVLRPCGEHLTVNGDKLEPDKMYHLAITQNPNTFKIVEAPPTT